MRKNSVHIMDAIAEKRKRGNEIINLCKTEVRDLTEDEEKEVDALKREIKELNDELEELKKRAEDMTFEDEDECRSDENEDENQEEASEEDENTDENKQEENKSKRNMRKEKFSLFRSIRSIVDNKPFDAVDAAVIEKGKEEARNAGVSAQGQIVLPEKRGTITVTAEGGDIVETEIYDLLMPLRAKSVLAEAGAKFYTGLQGDVQVPVMGKSNVFFEGEVADAEDGAPEFSSVKLSPKRITAYVDISRKTLIQATPDVENAVITDLGNALAEKVESTVFGSVSGSTTQFAGIFSEIPVSGTVATFADLVNKEADVEDANVGGEKVYVLSNKAKAGLRAMAKSAKSTELVYEKGEVDGTKAYNTSNVGGKNFVYGNFNDLAIGTWNTSILVDPYTQATKSTVRIIAETWVDAKILRKESFATGTLA